MTHYERTAFLLQPCDLRFQVLYNDAAGIQTHGTEADDEADDVAPFQLVQAAPS